MPCLGRLPCAARTGLGATLPRMPARSVEFEAGSAHGIGQCAQHAPSRPRLTGQLAAGGGGLVHASRLVSVASIYRHAPIGRITSATRRVDWQANWLNATTCASPSAFARPAGRRIQARLDAVDEICGARLVQHGLGVARDRQHAVARQPQRVGALGMRHTRALREAAKRIDAAH